MSVSIDIVPLHDSLHMCGEPDPFSAYSISGHISISLASTSSLFDSSKAAKTTARLLLQSLTLTFEGQTELISPSIGYVSARLCTLTRELAPPQPVELSNEGHEDDGPMLWNVVFDLHVPGWLPSTAAFGEGGGIRYTLHAEARFTKVDDSINGASSFLSTLCSPFRSKTRIAHAPMCDIVINRFTCPAAAPLSPTRPFPIYSHAVELQPSSNSRAIPSEVLESISAFAFIPDYINIDDDSVPLSLRLCTDWRNKEQCDQLRITDVSIEIEQLEHYYTRPSRSYISTYPIPPASQQPPIVPLLAPNTACELYEFGYITPPSITTTSSRLISLLPTGDSIPIEVTTTIGSSEDAWCTLESIIPFTRSGLEKGLSHQRWGGPAPLRPTSRSPLLDVRHMMHVVITCTYTDGESIPMAEQLEFSLPLRFVEVAPVPPPPSPSLSSSSMASSSSTSSVDLLDMSTPLPARVPGFTLPPYSQLFEANGERKIDWDVPLPLYEPPQKRL